MKEKYLVINANDNVQTNNLSLFSQNTFSGEKTNLSI